MAYLHDNRESFPNTISSDLFKLVIGKEIGFGHSRKVFEYLPDPNMVIKCEDSGDAFANVLEFKLWQDLQYNKHAKKWVAPCYTLSANGIWLLQARTDPPPRSFKWPKQVPAWLTDCKKENFGLLKGKLVCHDYALHKLCDVGARMRKSDFWSNNDGSSS